MNHQSSIQPHRAFDWTPRPAAWWRRAAVAAVAASVGLSGLAVTAPASAVEHADPEQASVSVEVAPAPDERAASDTAGTADETRPGAGGAAGATEASVAAESAPEPPAEQAADPADTGEPPVEPGTEASAGTAEAEQPDFTTEANPQPVVAQPSVTETAASGEAETHSDAQFVRTPARLAATGSSGSTAAAMPAAPNVAVNGASLPLAPGTFRLSAPFGATGGWSRYHTGMDFSAADGTPVYAIVSGTVVATSAGAWAGTHVAIQADDGSSTLYAHLSGKTVIAGDRIEAGEVIGFVGQTGRAFGAHLHLEYYPAGATPGDVYSAADPLAYLRSLGLGI